MSLGSLLNSPTIQVLKTDKQLKLNFDAATKLANGNAHGLATSVDEIKLH